MASILHKMRVFAVAVLSENSLPLPKTNYLGFRVPSPSLKVRGKVQNFQVAFLQKKIKILHIDLFLSSIISAPNQLQIPNLSL